MDSLITAAARALAVGDPLGALNRVALRSDPPALALRGIAMAQLGDLDRARVLLRNAARAFGTREAASRARCVVAEAEIALVTRDLGWPAARLDAAGKTLEAHGDHVNAAYARHLEARLLLLTGHVNDAERALAGLDATAFPPALRAAHELVVGGIAIRRIRTGAARDALARAAHAARLANIPALMAEVKQASHALEMPAARLIARHREQSAAARRGGGDVRIGRPRRGWLPQHRAAWRRGDPARHAAGVSSPSFDRWPRRGRPTSRAMSSSRAPSEPGTSMNRIVRGCAWKSPGCVPSCVPWPTYGQRRRVSRSCRTVRARWRCWRNRWRTGMRRCSRCSPMAKPGPARRSPWHSTPASVPCSARSMHWPRRGRCTRSAEDARADGRHLPWPDSRQPCCSPLRSRSTSLMSCANQMQRSFASTAPFPG